MNENMTGDARFFSRSGPHSLADVVKAACGVAPERALHLDGVAPLQSAGPNEVSFLSNRRYASELDRTSAGAVIVHPDMRRRVPAGAVPIQSSDPYMSWARVAALFHPLPPVFPGIHPSAIIAESARIDATSEIGPSA
jgi:UDP-3-O-[3-hydroxymyristoyl] glucosamine N-acyltransferase